MKKFKNFTLQGYCDILSSKEPVPGGGSAAALSACLGASLICMVTHYSLGRKNNSSLTEKQLRKILYSAEKLKKRFLALVDLDAQAYLKVVKARKGSAQAKRRAQKASQAVPKEVCRLCYQAIGLTPFLVAKGNPYLVGDIEAAVEFLRAGFSAAKVFTKA